jgi:hypothetical protein
LVSRWILRAYEHPSFRISVVGDLKGHRALVFLLDSHDELTSFVQAWLSIMFPSGSTSTSEIKISSAGSSLQYDVSSRAGMVSVLVETVASDVPSLLCEAMKDKGWYLVLFGIETPSGFLLVNPASFYLVRTEITIDGTRIQGLCGSGVPPVRPFVEFLAEVFPTTEIDLILP